MNKKDRLAQLERKLEVPKRTFRLWCADDWRDFQVFKVPVESLALNIDNRRFTAERKLIEEMLGRPLDPDANEIDEHSVVSLLCDDNWEVEDDRITGKPTKNFIALKADWQARKQETPLWIRPDGVVRNGNRRLAMLKRLRAERGAEGANWVEVIVLSEDEIDETTLFEMEQHEQLTENHKVRYTDINLLLILKEAANSHSIDWSDNDSIEHVAELLQDVYGNGDKSYAIIQLQAIRYMDAYLADSGTPGQYQKLLRQVERFRDVGKVMAMVEQNYPDDAADMLSLVFSLIRAGNPHDDIREIRKMFLLDRQGFNDLAKVVEQEESVWAASNESKLSNPDLGTDVSSDDSLEPADELEPEGPVVPNYPKERVQARVKTAVDVFRAKSSIKNVKKSDESLAIESALQQAVVRLESLEFIRLNQAIQTDESGTIADLVRRIAAWSRAFEDASNV